MSHMNHLSTKTEMNITNLYTTELIAMVVMATAAVVATHCSRIAFVTMINTGLHPSIGLHRPHDPRTNIIFNFST